MDIAASVATDFARGITHYPFLAGGIMFGWVVVVGIGMVFRRRRFWRAWWFEWLIWTYLLTGLVLDVLVGGAQIADPDEWVKPPIWDFLSNVTMSAGIGLLWPLVDAALLYEVLFSDRSYGAQPFAVGLAAVPMAVGAALAFVIATASYGLPRFEQARPEPIEDA